MDMHTRRTIRRYSDEEVEPYHLMRLLEDASRTQTMGNLQLYSVIVTRSKNQKRALAPAHFNQPMVEAAPVVLTICADVRRTTKWAQCRQANPGFDNLLSFANAATDALLFTQTFCNLAEADGLGLCYLGTTLYQPEAIIDVLQLPELTFPVATLSVGWPPIHGCLCPRRVLSRPSARGYRPLLSAQGVLAGELRVRAHQRQADAGSGVHRYTLHPCRQ